MAKKKRKPQRVDKLPNYNDVKVGERFTITRNNRDLTVERVHKHGKKRNLAWKIRKNKKAPKRRRS